ncbi:hypothetical protein JTB14_006694 [Gonioctena quinquepunctata]|nr:hypothetical protein JTB14_006694 [Gonioctena quinquepunctata]
MTPVYAASPHTPEKLYNYSHTLGRNCIERVNGVLEGRFRYLLGERKLRYGPHKVGIIVSACCILHNMCVKWRVPVDENLVFYDHEDIEGNHPEDQPHLNIFDERIRIQNTIIARYFQN